MAPRPALQRVDARPNPAAWQEDELVTLVEAAQLFFPNGPLTASGLRSAIARHELSSVSINQRVYTTPAAIRSMIALCSATAHPSPEIATLIERAKTLKQRVRRRAGGY